MGAAIVPIIGKLIVSVVVSKVASAVAVKVGLSEDLAGLVGIGAGLYAGSLVGTQLPSSTTTTGPDAVGMDLSTGMGNLDLSMNTPGGAPGGMPAAPPNLESSMNIPGGAPGGMPAAPAAPPSGGMLSEGAPPGGAAPGVNSTGGAPAGSTADQVIKSSMVTGGGSSEPSEWQKLMGGGKTMDLVMAGVKGYSDTGIAKDNREYPERVAKENEQGWLTAGTSGLNSLNPNLN